MLVPPDEPGANERQRLPRVCTIAPRATVRTAVRSASSARASPMSRHNSLFKQGRIEDSLNEHRAILAAMVARDAKATMKAMQAHFAHGLEAAT